MRAMCIGAVDAQWLTLMCTFVMLQFGVFWTNGQICSSTSRLLVQEGIAPAFYDQLKKRAESIKQCDPMIEDCRMGPVVSQAQLDKIMGFIEVFAHWATLCCMCAYDYKRRAYACLCVKVYTR